MSLTSITITRTEFDKFRELQVKKRRDWHAVFSTNFSENPWPFETYGLTPEELRNEIRKISPILIRVVGIYIEIRHRGGRFFINKDGVFLRPDDTYEQFICWDFGKDAPQPIKPLNGEAGKLQFMQWREQQQLALANKRRK